MVHSYYKYPFIQPSYMCSMHSTVTTFRGAVIKVEVANFCAAMGTLIDQDEPPQAHETVWFKHSLFSKKMD